MNHVFSMFLRLKNCNALYVLNGFIITWTFLHLLNKHCTYWMLCVASRCGIRCKQTFSHQISRNIGKRALKFHNFTAQFQTFPGVNSPDLLGKGDISAAVSAYFALCLPNKVESVPAYILRPCPLAANCIPSWCTLSTSRKWWTTNIISWTKIIKLLSTTS